MWKAIVMDSDSDLETFLLNIEQYQYETKIVLAENSLSEKS